MSADLVDGRYIVERELGRGGMGVVYLAKDVNLNRSVAVKLISPEFVRHPSAIASFQREARALARVRSDHVVQVHAYGPHERSFFFAMEFVEGRTLGDIIDEHLLNGDVVPQQRALTILRQLASGLDAVHVAGTVHRDVKPDNVLIEHRTGRPVLIDFGLATSGSTSGMAAVGMTPQYASPEQANGATNLDARADQYAFATMAFELLCGHLPFDSATPRGFLTKQVNEPPPRISGSRPELQKVDEVLLKALSKDPSQRFASCGALVGALDRHLEDEETRWSIPTFTLPAQPQVDVFNVLVIGADPALVRMTGRAAAITFHGTAFAVDAAGSEEAALKAASQKPPSLLIIDPSGLDVARLLEELRRSAMARPSNVVILTEPQDQWRYHVLGVDQFIDKPLAMGGVLKTMEKLSITSGWKRVLVPHRESRSGTRGSNPV